MNKIVFMGTPDFAVDSLKKLNENDNISVELVISRKDKKRNRGKFTSTPVKQYALENKIEVLTPENINDRETVEKIFEINPDFLIVVAYGQVIGDELLKKFQDRIINVHSSILPKYRGAAPINWVLIDGENETGVTIMLVDKKLDTGDMLKIVKTPIKADENAEELHDKLKVLGANALVEVVNNFDLYYKNRIKQDENLAIYKGTLEKSMGYVEWNTSVVDIFNKFRGMYPWPGSFFNYKEDIIVKIHEMSVVKEKHNYKNGEVVSIIDGKIKIAAKDGYVFLKKIQFPNKKAMNVSDFLRGNEFEVNIVLN